MSQNPTLVSQNLGKKVSTLASFFWGQMVSYLCLSLSMVFISSLWTSRVSSLTNSHSSNMAGCLNPYLTELYKSSAYNSLTEILIPASWERKYGGPSGSQLWTEDWVLWLVPSE